MPKDSRESGKGDCSTTATTEKKKSCAVAKELNQTVLRVVVVVKLCGRCGAEGKV